MRIQLSTFPVPASINFPSMGFIDEFRGWKGFVFDPEAPVAAEFERLAHLRQWKKGSRTWKQQWKRMMADEESSTAKTALQKFFEEFEGFVHDPTASLSEEFARLGRFCGWKEGSKRWRSRWKRALLTAFQSYIFEKTGYSGEGRPGLVEWQAFCKLLGIVEVPSSITQCRKALARVYVNLVDFLDCWTNGEAPKKFSSQLKLADYTRGAKKWFPRSSAKQNPLLRVLLRELV